MKNYAITLKLMSLICMTVLLFTSCTAVNSSYFFDDDKKEETTHTFSKNTLTVEYFDVGQADSILVMCGGKSMLIDGGNVDDSEEVVDEVSSSVDSLDYVVNTHAHEDHCGGLAEVVENIKVKNAIISPTTADSVCYTNFVSALKNKNVSISKAKPGEEFALGDAKCTIIGPFTTSENLNNTSVVIKLQYFGKTFLFMGDAEMEEEKEIIDAGFDVKCDVLKAGHHGSETSSSYVFLREAMPNFVVVSVGENNSYGHPSENTISRFTDLKAEVFRTDKDGTITAVADKKGNIKIYK